MAVTRIWDADNSEWLLVGTPVEVAPDNWSSEPIYYETPGTFAFVKADHPGLLGVTVEVLGGGGAGGGAPVSTSGNVSFGAGGSSGAYARRWIPVTDLPDSAAIVVGAAGTGVSGGNGGNGGTSSFTWSGGVVTGNGGSGGNTLVSGANTSARTLLSGGTALATGGDLNVDGVACDDIQVTGGGSLGGGGDGAPSIFGGGGLMVLEGTGGAANSKGAGGGGMRNSNSAVKTGGAGGPGVVVVTPVFATGAIPVSTFGYREGAPVYYKTPGTFSFAKGDFPGASAFKVEVQGGQGAGGGVGTTAATTVASGGGGGGGGYARSIVLVNDLDVTEVLVVGAGGTPVNGGVGNNGIDSVLDTISGEVRGNGGVGGQPGVAGTIPNAGGTGGNGGSGTGDFVIPGAGGSRATANSTTRLPTPYGGNGFLGPLASPFNFGAGSADGSSGTGTGARNGISDSPRPGGSGFDGIVIVTPLYPGGSEGGGASGDFLPLAGGTLTGPLTLSGAPSAPLHATTKAYVDSVTGGAAYLPLAGGTMTGLLTLSGPPTAALHAATKAYADLRLPLAGGTMTGFITLHAAPTATGHAASKAYVDGKTWDYTADVTGKPSTFAPASHAYSVHTSTVPFADLPVGAGGTQVAQGNHTHGTFPASISITGNITLSGNLHVGGTAYHDYLVPNALYSYENANGSIRWRGTGVTLGQSHTSSSLEHKVYVQDIDLDKSVFNRLDPIWFRYAKTHPFKKRWDPDSYDRFENPEIGRMGFSYEQLQEVAPHWTYETDDMKAVGYEGMLPDFMAWTVASIKALKKRLEVLENGG